MKGTFNTESICTEELRAKGFKFHTINGNNKLFINEAVKELAEVFVYSDGSASALIGSYKDKTQH